MAKVKNFKTIFPAVSVPLNDDYSINEPEFRAYLRWIKSFYGKGIEGLVCNGHTGEITGLTRAERKRVVEICSEECGDVMTIISGVNCENTTESIEMAKEAKEVGADGILLMPPHMKVIKKDGTLEEFDGEKIVNAVNKSASRVMITLDDTAFHEIVGAVLAVIKEKKQIPRILLLLR